MSTTSLHAAALEWGQGNTVFEMFLEPTCPFSVTALRKIEPLLAAVGEDAVTVKIRILSQPWHLLSGVVCRCVLAASTLEDGREKAWRVLQAVADHRQAFVLEDHATGPNRQASVDTIIARLEDYSGVALHAAFAQPALQDVIKWHARYARQNGIHVTPTFMLNGLIAPALSSGDEPATWADAIRAAIRY